MTFEFNTYKVKLSFTPNVYFISPSYLSEWYNFFLLSRLENLKSLANNPAPNHIQ